MKEEKEETNKKVNKTKYCKHSQSCLENILFSSGRTFTYWFMGKYLVSKLFRLKEIRSVKALVKVLFTLN